MASPNIHPEFGYLCTSPRWRRDLRVAGYSILVGTVIGAGAIIALGAGGNRAVDNATDGRAATSTSGGETRPFAQAEATPAATVSDRAPSDTGQPDASEPERGGRSDTASSDAGKNDAAKPDVTRNDVAKIACGNDFWARRDPACLAPKPRRVRVREATDGASIAGVPIGRATPAEVNAPSAPAAKPDAPQAVPAAAAEAAPDNATAAPPSAPVVAPKKPQKAAHSQNRRRDEGAEDFLWRDERADGGRSYGDVSPRSRRRDEADDDHSRRGDNSAREERAARRTSRSYDDDDHPRRGFGRDSGLAPRGPLGPGGLLGALFGGGF